MTKYDAVWADAEETRRKWMAENSLYSEETEHSSCGVGLVVAIDGSKSRKVVENRYGDGPANEKRRPVNGSGRSSTSASCILRRSTNPTTTSATCTPVSSM